MTEEESTTAILYSANFAFFCPNCHREQNQSTGRNEMVYTCRSCDREYKIKITFQISDAEGNNHVG